MVVQQSNLHKKHKKQIELNVEGELLLNNSSWSKLTFPWFLLLMFVGGRKTIQISCEYKLEKIKRVSIFFKNYPTIKIFCLVFLFRWKWVTRLRTKNQFDSLMKINMIYSKSFTVAPTIFLFFPANIYLFKVNNKNTTKRGEICSKLTIKTPEQLYVGTPFLIKLQAALQLH